MLYSLVGDLGFVTEELPPPKPFNQPLSNNIVVENQPQKSSNPAFFQGTYLPGHRALVIEELKERPPRAWDEAGWQHVEEVIIDWRIVERTSYTHVYLILLSQIEGRQALLGDLEGDNERVGRPISGSQCWDWEMGGGSGCKGRVRNMSSFWVCSY